jgi:hypothetical protein
MPKCLSAPAAERVTILVGFVFPAAHFAAPAQEFRGTITGSAAGPPRALAGAAGIQAPKIENDIT